MNKFAMYFPWFITMVVLGFLAFVGVNLHDGNTSWEQKCIQDNGYPTKMAYMDYHSNWHRLCINPRSVVEVD
jgi:hypothetical protein